MKRIKSLALAVAALFLMATAASEAATIELKGAWGSESGPTGVKCKGPSTLVCATITTNVYPSDPYYQDHLRMYDAMQLPIGDFQVHFIAQVNIAEALLEFKP